MNLKCIKLLICFIWLCNFNTLAQIGTLQQEKQFLQHLTNNKLYSERLQLLIHIKDSASQFARFEKAWTYHAMGDYGNAKQYYSSSIKDSLIASPFYSDYLQILFQTREFKLLDEELNATHNLEQRKTIMLDQVSTCLKIYNLEYKQYEVENLTIDKPLYSRTVKAHKKSNFLAGAYAAAIPGAGKLYYGKKHEALNAFAASLLFGLQAYESWYKAGPQSFRFIFFGTGFSIFYLSNIYGSVRGLKKHKKDLRNQLHHEISNTYFSADKLVHPAY